MVGAEDILAAQFTPMITRSGEMVGVLSTQYRRPCRPSEDELRLIDLLAWTAAEFVERHRADAVLRRMTNVPGIGILTFDIVSGALIDANDAFLAMSGYTRGQVERRELTWRRMTPPEHVAVSEEQMRQLASTGRIGPYEKEYFRSDGSRSWMLFSGASVGGGRVVEYCIELSMGWSPGSDPSTSSRRAIPLAPGSGVSGEALGPA